MRTYQRVFEANKSVKTTANGTFFALLACDYPIDLEFEFVGQNGATDICTGIEAGYSEQFLQRITAVHITSPVTQTIKYGCADGVVKFDRVVTDTRVKNNRTKLGTMQTVTVQTPQYWDESENENLVGFYVKAAAANTETVLITNADSSPSHYTYWPDSLKVAAGTTKFFEHTGDIVKFALETGALSQLIKIVPVYRV